MLIQRVANKAAAAAVCREAEAQQRDAVRAEEAAGHCCQSQPHAGNLSFIKKAAPAAASEFIMPLCQHRGTEGTKDQEGKQQPGGGESCRWYLVLFYIATYFELLLLKSSCGFAVFLRRWKVDAASPQPEPPYE